MRGELTPETHDSSEHSYCRFRQAIALPPLRKSECEGDAQAGAATAKGFLIRGPITFKIDRLPGTIVGW
jgi:hypothetical protein